MLVSQYGHNWSCKMAQIFLPSMNFFTLEYEVVISMGFLCLCQIANKLFGISCVL